MAGTSEARGTARSTSRTADGSRLQVPATGPELQGPEMDLRFYGSTGWLTDEMRAHGTAGMTSTKGMPASPAQLGYLEASRKQPGPLEVSREQPEQLETRGDK